MRKLFGATAQLTAYCLFLCIGFASHTALGGSPVVRVSTAAQLQEALNGVPDGGVIEVAGGTYVAPSGGFTVYPALGGATRGFAVRAAVGSTVVFSGAGAGDILRLTTPQLITFERINFSNGVSAADSYGSALTISHAQVSFTDCTFQNNASTAALTGGGVRIGTSDASFQRCTWTNNTSRSFGAAITADKSRVFIRDSQFSGNRIDVAGHVPFSAGGAIHANTTKLRIANSRFENNHAAYVGGAIYAYGPWTLPYTTPMTELVVSDCLFVNNAAAKLAGDTFAAPPTGGAVMLEDQTHGQFYNCRFVTNSATQGGALSSYRSRNEVQNCVFRNNRAVGTTGAEGLGGAVMVLSDDNPDGSTAGGTINRPSAALTVTDTLLEGPGSDIPIARQGGGIFAGGDLHSTYGVGVQQNGSPATNRTTVNLKRVVFANLATAVGTPGTGGALTGDFVSLTADSCIIENCRTDQFGGGFEFGRQSDVAITNTTFSSNTAGLLGGAVAMLGGNLTISRSNLVENAISGAGGGAAIWTAPAPANGPIPPLDMTGGIQNCIISNNSGAISIYDGDRRSAPFNRMHYNGNQIFFAIGTILFNDVAGNKTVETLNAFTSNSVARSIIPNTVPATAPVAGAVLMVPPSIFGSGAPGETVPTAASVAYAETGAAATVDGVAQSASAGLVTTGSAAQHTLHVATTALATTPLPAAAVNISTRLSVGKGDDALIGGFIVFGSSPKRVLIRAVGPSLPIPGALQDPTLELHSASGATIAANDDWRSTVVGGLISQNQSVDIIASAVAPTSDLESGIVVTLDPGSYTAVLRGKNNTTGVGLLEIYDLDPVQNATLANISTRGFVESADNVMIAGFIYAGGPAATRVAVRGLGPSLTASGVPNALEDPVLELRNSNGTLVEMNDDWSASPQNAAIGAAQLQPTSAAESTIYRADLVPGAYTAVLRGKSNGTGVGLIEVYVF